MSDPFAPSSDPDIPTPSRDDLLPLVHGSVRDQLAAGTLDARHAENEWAGARRVWDEGHKRDAERRRTEGILPKQSDAPDLTNDDSDKAVGKTGTDPKPRGVRVPATGSGQTERQREEAELLTFMPKQVREEYRQASPEQKAVIWEANRTAFEAAKERKEKRLLRETERTGNILDMLQRLREDPNKG